MNNLKPLLLFAAVSTTTIATVSPLFAAKRPNVIIIFTDDQGYQDVGCYGAPLIKTPNLDRLAEEGLRFTNFYVSSSVSSASRAGLLTGRLNIHNGVGNVFFPGEEGMSSDEVTIAEEFKEQGYRTACFGKWHLGDADSELPTSQGFEEYFGIPYSNDMYIGHKQRFAEDVKFREGYTMERAVEDQKFVQENFPKRAPIQKQLSGIAPLFEGSEIIEYPCELETTTNRYFSRAIDFIERCGDEPFFAYITPAMPHTPLAASEQFLGKSAGGLYGDVMEEIDWNIGRLLEYLDESGLAKNTIVIFSSDNGPWLGAKENGGSADPFRDGKFSMYEGGVRVPFIVRWPSRIKAGGESDAIVASIDLLPTLLSLSVGKREFNQELDGVDQSKHFLKPSKVLRDEYLYVRMGEIRGIRKGEWIYLPKAGAPWLNAKSNPKPELFNITTDIGQQTNLYSDYPEVVVELEALIATYR